MKIILLSFQRSGSHFLKYSIISKYDVEILKHHLLDHDFDKDQNNIPIIGLIRDPIDSISSIVALLEKRFKKLSSEEIENKILEYSKLYLDTLNFIKDKSKIIIDYDDLSNINEVLNNIGIKFNLKLTTEQISLEEFYKNVPFWKKESSKDAQSYIKIKETVKKKNLTEQYRIYYQLKDISKLIFNDRI